MAKFRAHLVSARHLVWTTPQRRQMRNAPWRHSPPPTSATLTPEATPKRLTEEATDSTDEDCWTHEPSWMQGPKMSMPPNTFTRLIRLRSSSSDSSDSTWDTVDEKSGVPSATVAALGKAEPVDPHLLAPRRRVLKRPAAQTSRDSFKDRRSCPHVLCSPHLFRRLNNCLTTEKDDVAAVHGDKHGKSWGTNQRRTQWLCKQMTATSFRIGAHVHTF